MLYKLRHLPPYAPCGLPYAIVREELQQFSKYVNLKLQKSHTHTHVNTVKHTMTDHQNWNTLSDSCSSEQRVVSVPVRVIGPENDRRRHMLRWLLSLLGERRSYNNKNKPPRRQGVEFMHSDNRKNKQIHLNFSAWALVTNVFCVCNGKTWAKVQARHHLPSFLVLTFGVTSWPVKTVSPSADDL